MHGANYISNLQKLKRDLLEGITQVSQGTDEGDLRY